MPERPIETSGIIREARSDRVFGVELQNGKRIVGHLPGRLAKLGGSLRAGTNVWLEMTPFDFEKGRITGIVEDPDE
ncbi:MAG: translation initiation factor IF-1 [Roseibacillus sp.]|nr:translation initiation factor IF-1 [Roseibacillus sp.]HCQ37810.1 translation initiation factor IF-1 [Verrucomicrobiales bacterium]|tara:strand:- start:239 stop:466 length:228 start_codon:yes stop_codon:yes gene_type:complete